LADLLQGVKMFPQCLLNVRLAAGVEWESHEGLAQARAEAEAALGDRGRVLIRASGTEPVLRIMVEAEDEAIARREAEKMAASIRV
jgi:phosphoglucosamine mutase